MKFQFKIFFYRVSPDFFYEPFSSSSGKKLPWKKTMIQNTLSFLLYDEYFYNEELFSHSLNKFRIIIHNIDELPFRNGRHFFPRINSSEKASFVVQKSAIDKLLVTWSPENRRCFSDGEKRLKFFRIYSKKNCEHECLSNEMLATCGCVPFYMIRKLDLYDQAFSFLT